MNSEIILCKNIKLDKNYVNVLNYTEEQMLNLCRNENNIIAYATDYSFIRPQNSIFVGFTYEQCLHANYIAFQNKDYSNKWFFAFIDEVIYKSNKNTEIRFTVDVWSTWFNNWTASPCFIEREHVNDDSIGANTINENLSIEEVVQEGEDENISLNGENHDFYYIIMTTYNPSEGTDGDFVGVNRVNKNLFGAKLYAFNGSSVGATWVRNFLKHTNNKSKIESIQALFIAPRSIN